MSAPITFRAEIDESGVASCRAVVPYDVDRAFRLTTRTLLRIIELGRTAPTFEQDWCGLKALFAAGLPWLLKSQEVLVYPSAAKLLVPQAEVRLEAEMTSAGQRSFAQRNRIVQAGTGQVLAVSRSSFIVTGFDKETGKRTAVSLPPWFLQRLPSRVAVNRGEPADAWPQRLEPWTQQGAVRHFWSGRVIVRPSDTDGNGHVNNANYVMMAEDVVADAAKAGRLPGFAAGDLAGKARLRSVQVQYEREAFWGDELAVHLVSLSGDGPGRIAFEIRRPSSNNLLLVLGILTFVRSAENPANDQQSKL